MNQKPNAAEELGYPAWVVPFAALVVFMVGAAALYACLTFILLDPNFSDWSSVGRACYVVMLLVWGKQVWTMLGEFNADEE